MATVTLPPKTSPVPRAVPATPLPSPPLTRRADVSDWRPLRIVMFAIIACGMLVAAAFAIGLPGQTRKAGGVDEVEVEPATYALEATGDLSRLSSLPRLPDTDVGLTAAEQAAQQQLRLTIEQALADLEAALAAAALPEVPQDYVPGAEVDVRLPAAQPYPLPSLPDLQLGDGTIRFPEVPGSLSPVGPREGTGTPLDDVLGQLEGLQSALEDLLGESPVPVEGLPPVGGGPLGGLPLGGGSPTGSPEPVQETGDAVDPDEDGALRASAHAEDVLRMTTGAYGSTAADLEQLLALYESLTQQVEDAIAEVRNVQDDATESIATLLEERLAGIEDQVAGLEAQASALVASHRDLVAGAELTATTSIQQAVDGQVAAVHAAGEGAATDLLRQATAVQADADQRKADIEAIVQAATVELGSGSADAQQALDAVQASATAATLKIDRDAKAQVAALQGKAADVRAEAGKAQARLQAMAGTSLDQINGTVETALSGDEDVRAYLMAVAQAQGALLEARETELATEAAAELVELADGRVEEIVESGLMAAQSAEDVLDGAGTLVGQVEDLAVGEVGKDLDYLVKVSEDYGRVPTEDRKARSAHWSTTALGLDGVLDQTLLDGRAIEALAEDVMDAASQAEVEIAALA